MLDLLFLTDYTKRVESSYINEEENKVRKLVEDENKLIELSELTLNEGFGKLVVEYVNEEDNINIMEVTTDDCEDVVWATTCKFKSVDWVKEVLDKNNIPYEYWEC